MRNASQPIDILNTDDTSSGITWDGTHEKRISQVLANLKHAPSIAGMAMVAFSPFTVQLDRVDDPSGELCRSGVCSRELSERNPNLRKVTMREARRMVLEDAARTKGEIRKAREREDRFVESFILGDES